jgi:hypothetical protein
MERIEWGRQGPRVVLVHGDVFDARATFGAMEPLAASHRLVLVNRRGFGGSRAVDGQDFDIDAGDVAEVLNEEPAIWWGTPTAGSCVFDRRGAGARLDPVADALRAASVWLDGRRPGRPPLHRRHSCPVGHQSTARSVLRSFVAVVGGPVAIADAAA